MDDLPSQAPLNDIPQAASPVRRVRRWPLGMFVLLTASLAAGVVLVGQRQELRRRAADNFDPVIRSDAATRLAHEPAFAGTIPAAPAPTFTDVPLGHPQFDYIESVAAAGISSGCGGGNYCPDDPLKRDAAAFYILRGIHGGDYTPPTSTQQVFDDVPNTYWAYDWINQLAAEGITQGCGGGNYCPEEPLKRADAAFFFLRAEHFPFEPNYLPPPATGEIFSDVAIDDYAAAWIEQLHAEGITSGCGGGNYCPDDPLKRAEAAVFQQRTFQLPMTTHHFLAYQDVPAAHPAYTDIETITNAGITAGCSTDPDNPLYCPDIALTRAEAAVFLLRAEHGGAYTPPAATGTVFTDVPADYYAAAWIEQFYAEGITSGCSTDPLRFCPDDPTLWNQWETFIGNIIGYAPSATPTPALITPPPAATPTPILGQTLIVCLDGSPDPDCQYFGAAGIQQAVDAGGEADTVLVKNGDYIDVKVEIGQNGHPEKHNLTITGESREQTILGGQANGNVITIAGASTGIVLSSLKITAGYSGIYLGSSAQAEITDNTITGNGDSGIYLRDSSRAEITNNTIYANRVAGINIYSCGDDQNPAVTAKNNIIASTLKNSDGTFGFGIGGSCLHDAGKLDNDIITYDLLWANEGDHTDCAGSEFCDGTGFIYQDPLFANPDNGDFHLQAGSPACAGGENGTYMGAFACEGPPTATPTPSPTPTPTPTLPPGGERFTFQIRIEGITTRRPDLPLTVTLKQNGVIIETYDAVNAVSDDQGIYTAQITDFDPGTYDVLVKAPSHLARKFENIVLSQGANSQDFRQYRKMRQND